MIDAVRGMRDVLPGEFRLQARVAAAIEATLARYGYQSIDLPIIERRDLYLRKLGEELVGKVYEFSFNGRDLALRPEWTASVLRSYVARMQDQPLPLRLRYAGPVFRNERPQRATYRQFTQTGVELIGGTAPRADAECVALACAGLDAAGVTNYRVRLGHIGLIRGVLAALGLAERTQGALVWSLERMRERGIEDVRARLELDDGDAPIDAALLEGLDDAQAEALLQHALGAIGVNLRFGTRPPEAIVNRLVRKLRRVESRENVERALELLQRLGQVQGAPDTVLADAGALLRSFGLPTDGLNDLHAVLELTLAHGVPADRLTVDMGLGRGLHYYTGMIFEIYTPDNLQLCGGGRYDDLVAALGGRQTVPAVGFAYGLERVVLAATAQANEQRTPEVLVVAADDAYPYALQVAERLRSLGYIATTDVRGRSTANNVRDAARRGASFLALVDSERQAASAVVWRDVATRSEQVLPLDALPPVETNG